MERWTEYCSEDLYKYPIDPDISLLQMNIHENEEVTELPIPIKSEVE